jgi:glutathione peroxidase
MLPNIYITKLICILFLNFFFEEKSTAQNIYDFEIQAIDSSVIRLSDYKGKKIVIVNTASKCGYTDQYEQLQTLYQKHKDNIVVIAFPANNFLWQEPGSNSDIEHFCKSTYNISFPISAKVSVKGRKKHPLFRWLITQPNPDFTGNIKWNFEKFLIDENGKLIHRYRTAVNPLDIEKDL